MINKDKKVLGFDVKVRHGGTVIW